MRRSASLFIPLAGVVLAQAIMPSLARADTATSANWSGYVAHRSRLTFRSVSATWHQPSARCAIASPAYSAMWVGLGGFARGASRLEQIGTELDCTASGAPVSTAWYELVPASSVMIRMRVAPGDLVSAGVTIVGNRVTLRLTDRTRHRIFSKTVHLRRVDVSSADWIVESPSACWIDGTCQTLPLADFGAIRMTAARAQTSAGRRGTISSRLWQHTAITLSARSRGFVGRNPGSLATPSILRDAGSTFEVVYSRAIGASVATAAMRVAQVIAAGESVTTIQPGGPIR